MQLLSEEVFDFSRGELTQAKIKELKQSLNNEFAAIHSLCEFALTRSQKADLIRSTLTTLHAFLTWVPLGYIFEARRGTETPPPRRLWHCCAAAQ